MFPWIDPRLAGGDLMMLAILMIVPVAVAIRTGPRQHRAALARLADRPDRVVVIMRNGTRNSWLMTLAALSIVLGAPGLTLAHLGLTVPDAAGWAATAVAALGSAGVQWLGAHQAARRRAAGGRLRGEAAYRQVRPMHPDTPRERAWAAVFSVSVGFGEEVFYRGLLIAVAIGLGLPTWAAIVLPALLFGLQHRYQTWRGVLFATLFGLVMTVLYATTESLWTPIAVHAAWDLMALLVAPRILAPALDASPPTADPGAPAPTGGVLDPTAPPAAATTAPITAEHPAPPAVLPRLRSAAPE
ncbi:CPBP family intramembrane glutamic endopeptidase [Dactylosporangium sucinum]|uniref:CPBP family intramembrane glutamic endopeptidase n=1 Tax=Dactylosporangium sucinum TaxID=1424081 RepID=UPI0035E4CB18